MPVPESSVQIESLYVDLEERLAALREDPTPVAQSRARVEDALTDGEAHYGINTGFGALAQKQVPREELETLQRNLVFSHAVGVEYIVPLAHLALPRWGKKWRSPRVSLTRGAAGSERPLTYFPHLTLALLKATVGRHMTAATALPRNCRPSDADV